MNQTIATRNSPVVEAKRWTPVRVTRSLLGYGVLVGPVYVASALIQGLTRHGFNLQRDDVSLLSNGGLGWIQILTLLVTGLMVITFAVGVARTLADGRGSTWGPRLIGLYGIGLIGAGLFVADPANGFPPGTPLGRPELISLHGMLHIVAGAIGFLGIVIACFIIASRFARQRLVGWAAFSRITGIAFLLAFLGIASGSGNPAVVLAFWAGLILLWVWMATYAVFLYRGVSGDHEV